MDVTLNTQDELVEALNETLPKYRRLANRLCRSADEHDDLMQDTYVAVLTGIRGGAVQSVEQVSPYLHGTMKFLTMNKWDRAGVRRKYQDTVLEHFYARRKPETPDEVLLAKQQKSRAQSMLRLLNKTQRSVMEATLAGKGKEQVIQELNITPTQYRLAKNRAKQRLLALCTEAVGS